MSETTRASRSTDGQTHNHMPPIAIIGVSSLFPDAHDPDAYWELIRGGRDAIGEVPETHWSPEDYFDSDPKRPDYTYCKRGGFLSPVSFDPTEFGIPPNALEATDTSQLLSLVVARRLMQQAGYGDEGTYDKQRIGVVLGVTGTQELVISLGARLGHPIWKQALANADVPPDQAAQILGDIADGYVSWQENSFPGLLGNVVAGRIASRLDFGGTNCVVDAACASSLSAMHLSIMELSSGRADMMISGGVDTLNDIFMYMCFSKTPALSPTGDARPFSADADGTVLGEGIGMVLLKRLDDARRDGDTIYAVVRGMGTSSDGRSRSIYAPRSEGQQRTLRRAYEDAAVSPRAIDLVEAHGTGTKVGDATEFDALKTVYSDASDDLGWCALGSVKAQIGHTKAAAGAASVIKAALALHHKVLPPTIKISQPNPNMGIEESPFYLNTSARPWLKHEQPRRAGVSSFGFGGSNFHLVLEEAEPTKAAIDWAGAPLLLSLSGDSTQTLSTQLDTWQALLANDGSDEHGGNDEESWRRRAAGSRKAFRAEAPHRLIFQAQSGASWADDLGRTLAKAQQHLTARTGDDGPGALLSGSIAYGGPATASERGQVAVLFPGQGSQYPQMGRDLLCAFPSGFATLQEADRRFEGDGELGRLMYPPEAFDKAQRDAQKAALADTSVAQPALGAAGLGMWRVLSDLGVQADMMAGHSYGELVALCAAGRVSEATFHQMSNRRGQLMAVGDEDRGTMLAVSAPLGDIEALLQEHDVQVVLANRNGPKQGVLSGSREAIEQAHSLCKKKGWRATALTVSAAFHSPLVEDARAPFAAFLQGLSWEEGHTPVYANATGALYPKAGDEACQILAQQLTASVRFVEQIEAMYEAGARTFVEVGPKTVLTGLVRTILGDQPHQTIALDASRGRKHGLRDLAGCLGQLAALGFPVALEQWRPAPAAPPKQKMSIPLVGANYRKDPPRQRLPQRSASATSPTQPRAPKPSQAVGAGASSRQTLPLSQTASVRSTGTSSTATHVPPNTASPTYQPTGGPQPTIGQAIMTQHSSDGADGRPQPTSAPAATGTAPSAEMVQHALLVMQEGIRSMQALQHETSLSHQRFLENQQQAQQALREMLHQSQWLVEAGMGAPAPSRMAPQAPMASTLPPIPPPQPVSYQPPAPMPQAPPAWMSQAPAQPMQPMAPPMQPVAPQQPSAPVPQAPPAPAAPPITEAAPPAAAPQSASAGPLTVIELTSTMLEVVSDLTGYPQDMLSLDMDMEADLGIDSIKRVEILSAVTERLPQLASEQTDHLGSLRTLQQIVEALFAEQVNTHSQQELTQGSAASVPFDPPQAATPSSPLSGPVAAATHVDDVASKPVERRRLALVALETPNLAPLKLDWSQPIWLTDDGTGFTRTLKKAFLAAGAKQVVVTPPLYAPSKEWAAFISEAPQERLTGVVLLAGPGLMTWTHNSERGMLNAFLLAKQAVHGLRTMAASHDAFFTTVSRMDGGFGLLRPATITPLQGGLAGLSKTLAREESQISCRAIDAASRLEESMLAEEIVSCSTHRGPMEVGISVLGEHTLELVPDAPGEGRAPLKPGDPVLITGGARGVTAAVAHTLAKAHQPHLFLWGRSPFPKAEPDWLQPLTAEAEIKRALLTHYFSQRPSPKELEQAYKHISKEREIRENLARIEATGAKVTYMPVDVRSKKRVQDAVEELRATAGPIKMLVHAAGVIEDKRIADKSQNSFDRVFGTKVEGLRNLLSATERDPLHSIVLFSSVSGRTGNVGQVDYAMANEVLNKTARHLAATRTDCRVLSLNWGPWDGGMVTPALKRMFAQKGVELIGLAQGAQAMLAALGDHGAKDVEIILGAVFEEQEAASSANAAQRPAQTSGKTSKKPQPRDTVETARSELVTESAASMDELSSVVLLQQIVEQEVSLEAMPILHDHLLGGHPVVPMSLSLEWLAYGARHGYPGLDLLGMKDVRVLRGIKLKSERLPVQLWAGEAKQVDGRFYVPLELRDGTGNNGRSQLIRGRAVMGQQASLSKEQEAALVATLSIETLKPYPLSLTDCYRKVLFHGPGLRCIQTIVGHSPEGMRALLTAAPKPTEWLQTPLRRKWSFDPLAIDGAFQMAILWCQAHHQMRSLPTYIGALRQYKPFTQEGVICDLMVKKVTQSKMTCDFRFAAPTGATIAIIEGYECAMDASLAKAFHGPKPSGRSSTARSQG